MLTCKASLQRAHQGTPIFFDQVREMGMYFSRLHHQNVPIWEDCEDGLQDIGWSICQEVNMPTLAIGYEVTWALGLVFDYLVEKRYSHIIHAIASSYLPYEVTVRSCMCKHPLREQIICAIMYATIKNKSYEKAKYYAQFDILYVGYYHALIHDDSFMVEYYRKEIIPREQEPDDYFLYIGFAVEYGSIEAMRRLWQWLDRKQREGRILHIESYTDYMISHIAYHVKYDKLEWFLTEADPKGKYIDSGIRSISEQDMDNRIGWVEQCADKLFIPSVVQICQQYDCCRPPISLHSSEDEESDISRPTKIQKYR
jgi:hypothetical protein